MRVLLYLSSFLLLVSCSGGQDVSENITSENNTQNTDMTQNQQQIILAVGDSLTAGYGLDISESYPAKLESKLQSDGYNYKVINAGISGDTSKGLLDRAPLYLDQNPDIVLLVIGGNDGLRSLSTIELKKNIQSIIDIYSETSTIVLGGMDIPANFGLKYRRDFIQVYEDIAKENKDIYFLESFLEGVAGDVQLNQSDRIHPTSAGYDIIVANLYEYLEDEEIIKK